MTNLKAKILRELRLYVLAITGSWVALVIGCLGAIALFYQYSNTLKTLDSLAGTTEKLMITRLFEENQRGDLILTTNSAPYKYRIWSAIRPGLNENLLVKHVSSGELLNITSKPSGKPLLYILAKDYPYKDVLAIDNDILLLDNVKLYELKNANGCYWTAWALIALSIIYVVIVKILITRQDKRFPLVT